MTQSVQDFIVGDYVVYPAHGVGQINGVETQEVAGLSLEVYVITFDHEKMTLRVPTRKAKTAGLRPLASGDIAVVNYTGTSDGKAITELAPTAKGLTEQKNFWIETTEGTFIPGFAAQLIGASAGDKRTVNVDFPADFVTKELQGKKFKQ